MSCSFAGLIGRLYRSSRHGRRSSPVHFTSSVGRRAPALLSVCLKALRAGPTLPGRPRSLRRGLKRIHTDAQTGKDAEAKQLHLFAEAAAFEELTAICNA